MQCPSTSYSPSEVGLPKFDHNRYRKISHKLVSSVEGDTWNAPRHSIHLLILIFFLLQSCCTCDEKDWIRHI